MSVFWWLDLVDGPLDGDSISMSGFAAERMIGLTLPFYTKDRSEVAYYQIKEVIGTEHYARKYDERGKSRYPIKAEFMKVENR